MVLHMLSRLWSCPSGHMGMSRTSAELRDRRALCDYNVTCAVRSAAHVAMPPCSHTLHVGLSGSARASRTVKCVTSSTQGKPSRPSDTLKRLNTETTLEAQEPASLQNL